MNGQKIIAIRKRELEEKEKKNAVATRPRGERCMGLGALTHGPFRLLTCEGIIGCFLLGESIDKTRAPGRGTQGKARRPAGV